MLMNWSEWCLPQRNILAFELIFSPVLSSQSSDPMQIQACESIPANEDGLDRKVLSPKKWSCFDLILPLFLSSQTSDPMQIHAGLRRKHRKTTCDRLTETVCANVTGYSVLMQECGCGKKCFEEAVRHHKFDVVVDIIKYCQSEVRDKPYDEKFSIMRPKVIGNCLVDFLIGLIFTLGCLFVYSFVCLFCVFFFLFHSVHNVLRKDISSGNCATNGVQFYDWKAWRTQDSCVQVPSPELNAIRPSTSKSQPISPSHLSP